MMDPYPADLTGQAGESRSDIAAEPIAIIGMAARVPGADGLDAFWRNLVDGVESVTVFSRKEQLALGVSEEELDDPAFVPAAPVLDEMERFDAPLFGMTAREAAIADPQQRVFLEQAHAAMLDAGYDPARYPGDVGVYAGSGADEYQWLNVRRNSRVMGGAGVLGLSVGNKSDYIATTVSYKFNLRGPSLTVHTACSTALVAVHLACEALRGAECDAALAGGVCIELPHGRGYYGSDGYTSPDGHCRPFDAGANGTVWGSGAGVVVLKRLSDALADGDHIRAVVRGNAINNDGASKVGFSAPSVAGQVKVIGQALGIASLDPRTVGYVEAHGTGTALGDPIEFAALSTVYSAASDDRGWCGIGSVKSNIGHLSQAAGAIGLIKTVLALEHGIIPPTANFERPNPAIDFADSPFYVVSVPTTWPRQEIPRRAAISSFGIGGTNAHVIVEEAPSPSPAQASDRRPRVIQVSARTEPALTASVERIATHLAQAGNTFSLADVTHTLRHGRPTLEHRAAVVAYDLADAAKGLRERKRVLRGTAPATPPRIALIFSGQGAQYAGMGAELYGTEKVYADAVDECARLLMPHLKIDLRTLLLAEGNDRPEADARLRETALAQPGLFTVGYALAQLWCSWRAAPAAMIGHSIGEYVAAALAGVFSLADALDLVATRGRLMQQLPRGSMLAVQRGADDMAPLLPPELSIAAVNGPGTCVIAGDTGAVEALGQRLKDEGTGATLLRTSHAFHSPMMEPALEPFKAAVAAKPRHEPVLPYLSNVTGGWITPEQATDPAYWASHLRGTVRYGQCVATLIGEGEWLFVECGPGRQLAGLTRMQLKRAAPPPVHSLPAATDKAGDLATMYTAAARLWTVGAPLDLGAGEAVARRVPLPGYPYERVRHWVDPDPRQPADATATAPPGRLGEPAQRPPEEWFEVPTWRELPPVPPGTPPARVCVFAADERAEALAAALAARGAEVSVIRPGSAFVAEDGGWRLRPAERTDYDALVAALRQRGGVPERLVHAWGLVRAPRAANPIHRVLRAQDDGFYSVLWLAQALAAGETADGVQIDVVTAGTLDPRGGDVRSPEHATLAAAVRVLPLEIAGLRVRQVDAEATGPVAPLAAELCRPAAEPTVALRGERRWTLGYTGMRLGADLMTGGAFGERQRYLITGGLGGIGITLAEELGVRHRARLVLVGRTPLVSREQWDRVSALAGRDARAVAAIRRIEAAGGEVLTVAADCADVAALRRVRADVEAAYGGLDGIIHAAGVPGAGMAEIKTRAAADSVLAPKVAGTLALREVFGDLELDLVVYCSSVTSLAGGFGQLDYCAANAFLDAHARSDHGWRAARLICVNWAGWRDVGMAAETRSGDVLRALQGALPPTGAPEPVGHPIITRVVAGEPAIATGSLCTATQWVLDEHRVSGVGVLPGTGQLECIRAAVEAAVPPLSAGHRVELRDVVFTEPVSVADGVVAGLNIVLTPDGDGTAFELRTTIDATERVHTRGRAAWVPARDMTIDVPAVLARCARTAAAPDGTGSVVAFGARWDCLAYHGIGGEEEVAVIEAGADAAGEVGRWVLHPALLDVATSFGSSQRQGAYLPLGYGHVIVQGRLPERFISHVRWREDTAGGEVLCADITLADPDGRVLVEIEDYVLRRIDPGAVARQVRDQPAAGALTHAPARRPDDAVAAPAGLTYPGDADLHGADPDGAASSGTVPSGAETGNGTASAGMAPADAIAALRRVIAAGITPQVVISPVPVADVVAREQQLTTATVETAAEPTAAGRMAADTVQAAITGIWEQVLGVEGVDPDDDFFELGGNSLVAVQLIARVRATVGVRLPMRTIFEAPTVTGMAAQVEQLRATAAEPATPSPAGAKPPADGRGPGMATPTTIPRLPRPS